MIMHEGLGRLSAGREKLLSRRTAGWGTMAGCFSTDVSLRLLRFWPCSFGRCGSAFAQSAASSPRHRRRSSGAAAAADAGSAHGGICGGEGVAGWSGASRRIRTATSFWGRRIRRRRRWRLADAHAEGNGGRVHDELGGQQVLIRGSRAIREPLARPIRRIRRS